MANKKQDSSTQSKKLKWDPFSLRNPKYIQNTRKEVLKSIGVLSTWQKLANYPKDLINKISARHEARYKEELQKKQARKKNLIKKKERRKKILAQIKKEKEKKKEKKDQQLNKKVQELVKLKETKSKKSKLPSFFGGWKKLAIKRAEKKTEKKEKKKSILPQPIKKSHALILKKNKKKEQVEKAKKEEVKKKKEQEIKFKREEIEKKKEQEIKVKREVMEKKKKQELEFLKAKEKELKKVKWTSPEILKTNLVKDNIATFINWKKNISLLALGVAVSMAIVMGIYQNVVIEKKEMQEAGELLLERTRTINKKINLAQKNIEEVTLFQNKLVLVEKLLEKHIYWTNFFKLLEDITIEDVYYNNFFGDTGGAYTLSASAESFNMIATQIEILRSNDNVRLALTSGGSAGGSGEGSRVNFSLKLEINPEVFYR